MIVMLSLQLLLPLILVAWVFYAPQTSRLGILLQCGAATTATFGSCLAGIWSRIPRWSLAIVALIGLLALVRLGRGPCRKTFPDRASGGPFVGFSTFVLVLGIWVIAEARMGQFAPNRPSIALVLPVNGNDLLVANGGSRLLINAHQDTLDLSVPRHRLWHGQSYGVDLVALTPLQTTSVSVGTSDPANYAIFGRVVRAPCAGTIIALRNDRPDLAVPKTDNRVMDGNHIILRCKGTDVVMAHLKRGSVKVFANQQVNLGDALAAVGNSGVSDEPHLHIHAQTPATEQAPFSGKPVIMLFNGRFLARNDRI